MENGPIDPDRLATRFARLAVTAALDGSDPDGWPDRRRIIDRALKRFISTGDGARITQFLDASRNFDPGRRVEETQQTVIRMFLDLVAQLSHRPLSDVARSIDLMARELPRTGPRRSGLPSRGFVHVESDGYDADDVEPAADTLNHTLARLFLRLGPPPAPTEHDYAPVGGGGDGGAQA
ncbi:hypothetical protein ADK52_03660 [Streptomyces sp. WM6372]|uniref:hypothetical protein n=1 Tax=Streptomyces sp. WM6372 TaxID=1415555 RepID=UPI0006AE7858|nr:hypothetical protein [Streptomyces sp. WM6372]KOU31092.1 hypothetical protein ADK52_03660 [Streptomyces sp. WM6372]